MEVPDIINEPVEERGGETGAEEPAIEINEEAVDTAAQNFENANKNVNTEAKRAEARQARQKYLNTMNNEVRGALESTLPEADKASFKSAYDTLAETLENIEFDPDDADSMDKLTNAYDTAIKDLLSNMKEPNTFKKGLNAIKSKLGEIRDNAVNKIKKIFGDSTGKEAEKLRDRINDIYKKAAEAKSNPTKAELAEIESKTKSLKEKLNNDPKLDEKVKEIKPGADAETEKSLKDKIVNGLTVALGLATVAGLIWEYISYTNSNPQCYLMTGSKSGPIKTPLMISSSKCNCDIPPSTTPTLCADGNNCIKGQYYVKCGSDDMNKYACCMEDGLSCSPLSSSGGATYTYTPHSLGGFLKNIVDGVVVDPASGLFKNISDIISKIFKSLGTPIKIILIIIVVAVILMIGVKLYYALKPNPQVPQQYAPPPPQQYAPQQYAPQQYAPQQYAQPPSQQYAPRPPSRNYNNI